MSNEINEAVDIITDAANRIKEISEEVSGIKLADILLLHGTHEKVVVGRPINGVIYCAAGDVSTILNSNNFSDIRHKIVSRVTSKVWEDGYGTSPRTCFILK